MPDKIVQVDGVGNVAFPDSMKDEEISSVIKQQHPQLAPSALSQFGSTVTSDLNPSSLAHSVMHPIDTIKSAFGPGAWMTPEEGVKQGAETPLPVIAGHAASILAGAGLGKGISRVAPKITPDAIMSRVPQGFNPIPHVGDAIAAAAPDVAAGTAKAGLGLGLAEAAPGPLKWPARALLTYPGMRQIGAGLKAGAHAAGGGTAAEALADTPKISSPPPFKSPSVFGDPNGFAKLPQSVQDAIMRGQGNAPATPKPAASAYQPRSMESYGVTPTISSPKPALPSIQVPAQGAADVVERVEHPPFAADRPFPTSQKIREQTPAPTTPERADYEARVGRLKSAFPHETDQQIRARADEAIKNKKLDANGGAGRSIAEALRQSLGGK